MSKSMNKAAMGLAALMLAGAGVTSATAAQTTFRFSGDCGDCTGTATAELSLRDYTLGDEINGDNFVSFHYDGTDLLAAYTIDASNVVFLSGSINEVLPGPQDFNIFALIATTEIDDPGFYLNFRSSSDGFWCTGNSCLDDFGEVHGWEQVDATSEAPEPASWAMMIAGFGAVGATLRRRRTIVRFG